MCYIFSKKNREKAAFAEKRKGGRWSIGTSQLTTINQPIGKELMYERWLLVQPWPQHRLQASNLKPLLTAPCDRTASAPMHNPQSGNKRSFAGYQQCEQVTVFLFCKETVMLCIGRGRYSLWMLLVRFYPFSHCSRFFL